MMLGYTLAFSGDAPALGNLERAYLHGIGMDSVSPLARTIPERLFVMYQMTFAIITVALVAVTVAWAGVLTFVILKLVGVLTALRVTPEAEQMGLDVALHGESIHS